MNEALELIDKIETTMWSITLEEQTVNMIRNQAEEIERLKASLDLNRINPMREEIKRLKGYIESLVWENKGIAEWQDEWSNMKAQRDTIQAYYKQMKEALEAIAEGRWTLNKCERIAREALEGIK